MALRPPATHGVTLKKSQPAKPTTYKKEKRKEK